MQIFNLIGSLYVTESAEFAGQILSKSINITLIFNHIKLKVIPLERAVNFTQGRDILNLYYKKMH